MGGGGGGMLRNAFHSRVPGLQDAFSRSTTTNKPASHILSLSNSASPSASTSLNLPVSATSPSVTNWVSCACPYLCVVDDCESESGSEDDHDRASLIFGAVPSLDEVEDAISSLKQIIAPALYSQFYEDKASSLDKDIPYHIADPRRSEVVEPNLHLYSPKLSQSNQYGRVYDAFRLLQTEPSIQRMVMSLSSDKAVWDAVLKNELVKKLKESFCTAENAGSDNSGGSPDPVASILKWVLDKTKAMILELIEKLTELVNDVFEPPQKNTAETTDLQGERLKSSLMLSIVVLLIVVVTRAHGL